VEELTFTKSKKGAANPEFNKDHAHFFFDVKGIVHREFVPPNTMINSGFYCDGLRRLRENVRRRRPELQRIHNWLHHHDNAPALTSLKTTEFVTNSNMVIVPYPHYSPDLAPCDFGLLLELKMKLKGRRSETVSDVRRESQAVLDSIKENDFQSAFKECKKQWDRCIRSQGTILKEMEAKIQ
jgi:transposase